jgi:hypothetical protein
MKVKIVFAIAGFVLLSANVAIAQVPSYAAEALQFSRIQAGGTARVQGMGGVQNSLGGDMSSASYNPAGLGMYNRSDFSITPGYYNAGASTSYLGNGSSDNQGTFIVPNIGIAFHTGKDGSKGLWGGTFAISYNRTNDFNNSFSYKGTNPDNSIVDYFINDANGTGTSQFNSRTGFNYNTPTGLAYNNYLIGPLTVLNPNGDSTKYFTDVSGIPNQTETVRNSGSQRQVSISYGVNFKDKVFLGGGIGLASFRYKTETTYIESFTDANQPMSNMQLDETLSLSGSGINLTLGAIVRPIDQLQVGLSLATPTSYLITDNYSAKMSTTWKGFNYSPGVILNNEHYATDLVTSNYNLSTPWRFSGGATFFIQKRGFISADVEWLNYSTSKYSSTMYGSSGSYDGDNKDIKGLYKSTLNIRVGGEYRLNNYRFRGGYNIMPDPYQTQQNGVDRTFSSFSLGLGYRTTNVYVDMAVVLGQGNNSYRPYKVNTATSPLVTLNNSATSILFTIGFPF